MFAWFQKILPRTGTGFNHAYDYTSGVGAGAARRAYAVRWGLASNLLVAWMLTVPASALVAAGFYMLTRLF